ncbi:PREDICTED: heterogeneous nuclear ribonucleoprotein 27C-like [Amphimedon queenslandica]|uniref:RRM domain-containing protein n=1 Tax=Amphimedon queenslandica TaxID=400682 RepID=I1FF27_AMPQE|nr:PREDICTED: heterogeneous nuclear ribonucleoprotein 27C-like [Amphimedon queenslandica]|eukprot:XP_019855211.1 PREDICTED: heterogeneous nuclear ribonucleoprotein 27C-like [Amphimedon queenslandica]
MEMQGEGSAIEPGKIFVGGLSWSTTEDTFKKHFEAYGEIQDTKIMMNPAGNPRGFGFVTFKDPASVTKVLQEKHYIDDKLVDPKPATLKPPNSSTSANNKVFLGGLPGHCTPDQVKLALKPYGNVTSIDIKTDNNAPNSLPGENKKNRGFAFVDFENEKEAQALCHAHYITIDSRQVEAKKAEPRHKKGGTGPAGGTAKDGTGGYQQSGPYYGGVGRGMAGAAATGNPYYPYYPQYPFSQYSQYEYYGRGNYGGQQQLAAAAYHDASSGAFSQARAGGYGSSTEHFNGGAGFTSYDQSHITAAATGYYDQSGTGGISYSSHTPGATAQQRGSYSYGRS